MFMPEIQTYFAGFGVDENGLTFTLKSKGSTGKFQTETFDCYAALKLKVDQLTKNGHAVVINEESDQ